MKYFDIIKDIRLFNEVNPDYSGDSDWGFDTFITEFLNDTKPPFIGPYSDSITKKYIRHLHNKNIYYVLNTQYLDVDSYINKNILNFYLGIKYELLGQHRVKSHFILSNQNSIRFDHYYIDEVCSNESRLGQFYADQLLKNPNKHFKLKIDSLDYYKFTKIQLAYLNNIFKIKYKYNTKYYKLPYNFIYESWSAIYNGQT